MTKSFLCIVKKNDWYHPEWVNVSEVETINLVPETAKEKLLELL